MIGSVIYSASIACEAWTHTNTMPFEGIVTLTSHQKGEVTNELAGTKVSNSWY